MYRITIQQAIHALYENECPRDLLDPIEEWAAEPMADSRKLKLWREAAGIPAGPFAERVPVPKVAQ